MTKSVNLKLTHAVKDRAVQNFQRNGSEPLISFVDGSTMTYQKSMLQRISMAKKKVETVLIDKGRSECITCNR